MHSLTHHITCLSSNAPSLMHPDTSHDLQSNAPPNTPQCNPMHHLTHLNAPPSTSHDLQSNAPTNTPPCTRMTTQLTDTISESVAIVTSGQIVENDQFRSFDEHRRGSIRYPCRRLVYPTAPQHHSTTAPSIIPYQSKPNQPNPCLLILSSSRHIVLYCIVLYCIVLYCMPLTGRLASFQCSICWICSSVWFLSVIWLRVCGGV